MPKPQWLIDREKKQWSPFKTNVCGTCEYFGEFCKMTKVDGKPEQLFDCVAHPGTLNTRLSICCTDWLIK